MKKRFCVNQIDLYTGSIDTNTVEAEDHVAALLVVEEAINDPEAVKFYNNNLKVNRGTLGGWVIMSDEMLISVTEL